MMVVGGSEEAQESDLQNVWPNVAAGVRVWKRSMGIGCSASGGG